jgi:hypothetical protein
VSAGASYENALSAVPTELATVSVAPRRTRAGTSEPVLHTTCVGEDHDVVVQMSFPSVDVSEVVAVRSMAPKLRPPIVRE